MSAPPGRSATVTSLSGRVSALKFMQRASPSSSPSSAANTPVKSSQPASPASPLSTPGPSTSTLIPGSPSFGAEEEQWSLSPAAIARLRAKAQGQSQKVEAKGVRISQEAGFDAWLIEREKHPTSGEGKKQSARQTFGKLGKQKDEDEEQESKQDSKKRSRGSKEEQGQEPDFEESEDSDEEEENKPKRFVKPGSIKGKSGAKKSEGDSPSSNKKAKKNAKAGKDQDKVVFARKRGGDLNLSRTHRKRIPPEMTHSARPVEAGTTATAGKEVPFEKVLWRKQPFADNFVPPTFLSDLRTNSQVILPSLTQLMLASLRISTRFLHVILYTLWFVHLHLGTVDAELVLLLGGAAVALYTLVHVHVFISSADPPQPKQRDERRGKKIISKIIIAVVLLAVSPVLRTLTESTTSDSIWALSVVLFFLHLTLADYSSSTKPHVQKEASGLSDTLSFNAAMSASVVLASRLNTDSETFTLLALATMLFAPSTKLKPAAAEARGAGKTECIPFASAYVMTMATAMLFKFIVEEEEEVGWVGIVVVWVHLVVGFVSVVCPWWIVRAQRWKMEIKGPWDPAKPVITSK